MDFVRLCSVNKINSLEQSSYVMWSPVNLYIQSKVIENRFFRVFFFFLLIPAESSVALACAGFLELQDSRVFVVAASAKQFPSSLERVTIMPVCLTHSFTFTASALRVVNFRIIGTLIPPPFRQRPLGSSNGGPQTLLKVKIIHYFFFPCFSHGLHDDYLRQMYIYLRYISVVSIESHYKCLHLPSN